MDCRKVASDSINYLWLKLLKRTKPTQTCSLSWPLRSRDLVTTFPQTWQTIGSFGPRSLCKPGATNSGVLQMSYVDLNRTDTNSDGSFVNSIS